MVGRSRRRGRTQALRNRRRGERGASPGGGSGAPRPGASSTRRAPRRREFGEAGGRAGAQLVHRRDVRCAANELSQFWSDGEGLKFCWRENSPRTSSRNTPVPRPPKCGRSTHRRPRTSPTRGTRTSVTPFMMSQQPRRTQFTLGCSCRSGAHDHHRLRVPRLVTSHPPPEAPPPLSPKRPASRPRELRRATELARRAQKIGAAREGGRGGRPGGAARGVRGARRDAPEPRGGEEGGGEGPAARRRRAALAAERAAPPVCAARPRRLRLLLVPRGDHYVFLALLLISTSNIVSNVSGELQPRRARPAVVALRGDVDRQRGGAEPGMRRLRVCVRDADGRLPVQGRRRSRRRSRAPRRRR